MKAYAVLFLVVLTPLMILAPRGSSAELAVGGDESKINRILGRADDWTLLIDEPFSTTNPVTHCVASASTDSSVRFSCQENLLDGDGMTQSLTVHNQLGSARKIDLGFTGDMGCYAQSDFPFCTFESPLVCAFSLQPNTAQTIEFAKGCKVSPAVSVDNLPWGPCPTTLGEFTLSDGNTDTDVALPRLIGRSVLATPAIPKASTSGQHRLGYPPRPWRTGRGTRAKLKEASAGSFLSSNGATSGAVRKIIDRGRCRA